MDLTNSLLGIKTKYKDNDDPKLLFSIERLNKRKELGLDNNIPFYGIDIWNAYEISWLNDKGKPCVAIGEFYVPSDSFSIIESKSFKLYLNSFNNTKISSIEEVEKLIIQDLSTATQSEVKGKLNSLKRKIYIEQPEGQNIDNLDVECNIYDKPNSSLIKYEDIFVKEVINSNLLKSNCLVTEQPDWVTVVIKYEDKKLLYESIIKYLVSFRNHNEFHEQCIERIFVDIKNIISPSYLSVYAKYTRRGGIDICPYRSTEQNFILPNNNIRFIRQ